MFSPDSDLASPHPIVHSVHNEFYQQAGEIVTEPANGVLDF